MKKNYLFFIAIVLGFLSVNNLKAQCNLTLSTTAPVVCAGDTVTLTATATPPATELTTTFSGGNNHRGNMFDITATNTVTIAAFDAHPMGNTTIEIYYRTSPYSGFEATSSGWILVGSAAVIAQPFGTPTPVPVAVNVTIPAGQTYAFYVTSTNTSVSLNYTDGSSEGSAYTSDANITFKQGVGMEYPFTNGSGAVYRPRVWNGNIYYTLPTTTTYLWNTGASTDTIAPVLTATTEYTVQADVTGCPTMYDTIQVQVSVPPVAAGMDQTVCAGDSVTLSGSGAVSYAWDNGVTDTVSFVPAMTMIYTVTGTDSIGCTATDAVTVNVNNLPAVSAGPDANVCAGQSTTLSGSGAVSYTWDNGVTDGVAFTPAMTMTYVVTGTDANSCVNTDTVTLTVITVNAAVTSVNETMTATATGASYQWVNCSGYTVVPGATAQSYTATVNGSYAVIVNQSGCADTSSCTSITTTGIGNIENSSVVAIYPNPTKAMATINAGNAIINGYSLQDVTGKVIYSTKVSQTSFTVDLKGYPDGVYFIRIDLEQGSRTSKLIKQ